jgi:acyl-CoA thioesterase-1
MNYLKNESMRVSCLFTILLFFLISCSQKDRKQEAIINTPAVSTAQPGAKIKTKKIIIFFGNSLTAGLGLGLNEAFPALIQIKIDSLNLPYQTVNAGLSGETSAGGLSRVDWVLKQQPAIFVLELGANDALRGLSLIQTKNNLQKIIDKVKVKYPDIKIVVAGMEIPPNMGKDYAIQFKKLYVELAENNHAFLIPFLLDKVGGYSRLNQADGIHPTAEGTKIVAENVWKVLKEILK